MQLVLRTLLRLLSTGLTQEPGNGDRAGRPLGCQQLVATARVHQLLPTLASARIAEGLPVEDGLQASVELQRERRRRYRAIERFLVEDLRIAAVVLKGRTIAEHYPVGWVRETADLDLAVDGVDEVLRLGLGLEAAGWMVSRVTVFKVHGSLWLALDIVDRRAPDGAGHSDLVQVQGFAYLGDRRTRRPVACCAPLDRLSPAQRSLVEVTGAIASRGHLRGRDILDLGALVRAGVDLTPVSAAVHDLGLCQLWARLWEVARRMWPTVGLPARCPGPVERCVPPATSGLHAQADAEAVFAAGFPVTGAPVPRSPRSRELTVAPDGVGGLVFAGPIGSGRLHSALATHTGGRTAHE